MRKLVTKSACGALLFFALIQPAKAEMLENIFDKGKIFYVPNEEAWQKIKNECHAFSRNPTISDISCIQENNGRFIAENNEAALLDAMNAYREADEKGKKRQEKAYVERCYEVRARAGTWGVDIGCSAMLRGLLDVALPREKE